jgi:hypothetical protein
MTRALLRICALGLVAGAFPLAVATAAGGDETGFVPLFDGKTLDGWKKVGGGATYRIEGDTIVGESGPGPNTFLRTEKAYGDFIFKVEVKLDDPSNSGLQFRSHERIEKNGNVRVFGYQAEVDPSDRAWSGGIYDEARRGWLFDLKGRPEMQKAFKLDGWNAYVIEARGPHLKVTLNGVPCGDILDTMDLEGFLALQVHAVPAGKTGRIRWRNILLKDLGRSEWKPLWDGKTLNGWKAIGDGHWAIEDGAIHGTKSAGEARSGHLVSQDSYGDFAVRLKYRDEKGNSGIYFRAQEDGSDGGVKGIQADIGPGDETGGLYEVGGRGWLAKAEPQKDPKAPASKVVKAVKPGDWNELAVIALGDRIVVRVNGIKTAEVRDERARGRGHFALQLHGGNDMDVRFKDIEVLPLRE